MLFPPYNWKKPILIYKKIVLLILAIGWMLPAIGQEGTLLLRQPSISKTHVTFTYASDVWIAKLDGSEVLRITSTPAVESNPVISPDGETIAFSSNRAGNTAVYIVSAKGGTPKRLTWHPAAAIVRGWTQDGSQVLYASGREYAPSPSNRLWTIPKEGGNPTMLTVQRANHGSYSPDGKKMAIDQVSRWDVEWRNYRGGQNKPLFILDLKTLEETLIPNEKTTDKFPIWVDGLIYFLSDRDGVMNIWSYDVATKQVAQLTEFKGADIKWLSGGENLVFEREGSLNLFNPSSKAITPITIEIVGDFPWAETGWVDVKNWARNASLSATGQRVLVQARGDIFTVPVEHGDTRNLTQSPGVADRRPVWSPDGSKIAWFSDHPTEGYSLKMTAQDGLSDPETIDIGESKLAWEVTWSPDGKYLAFADDDLRVRIMDVTSKTIKTVDTGGINIERGGMGLSWSPDSQWLAYSKSGSNNFRRVWAWSISENKAMPMTDTFADAFSPTWDRDGKHLYFLASTDLALRSGWTNTSSMNASPNYAAYVINLQEGEPSPFKLRSDEEKVKEEKSKEEGEKEKDKKKDDKKDEAPEEKGTQIDFANLDRRTIALPMPVRPYRMMAPGPEGSVFLGEMVPNKSGMVVHKFELSERKASEFLTGAWSISISMDGKKMLARVGPGWQVMGTGGPSGKGKPVNLDLQVKLDRSEEWTQILNEAWRYQRDYFYDPNMHGRNWETVRERYLPLLPYVKHRADLTYVLDQMNGELSVGHSFVGGGDYPKVGSSKIGMLGADFAAEKGRWKITRIYTTEDWNPRLTSPLDQPGLNIKEGYYLVGINGRELTDSENLFNRLDGTLGKQTVLHLNSKPSFDGAWKEIVEPIRNEGALRQRAWVEDNRRMVDSLSNGKLAYVWVPNTSGGGLVSFNRYFFAQQDKLGAVIDERYNGGGLLDDYMVDLMTRNVRAAYTNEVPTKDHKVMPGGVLGPKVLLINEMAGSGGDFFPWVFRQQKAGLLIGATTWGGLVKSSTHYGFIDGGRMTAPDNAIFDPVKNEWIAENKGVAPDIPVRQDTKSLTEGKDPQLERAVAELLKQISEKDEIKTPPYPTPAKE